MTSTYKATLVMVAALFAGAAPEQADQGHRPNGESAAKPIAVDSVLVTLIEQVEVPAREAGVLIEMAAREGDAVNSGDLLAQVDDAEARLAKDRAQIERDIARMKAQNDIDVRFAHKSSEVADAELRRSQDSVDRYPKSVSQTELDRLRLAAERAALQIEQSELDFQTEQLTLNAKENEYQTAALQVERRKILAPLSGVVVQVNRRLGEWVQPGDTVFRMLRVDRLRAEGFIQAKDVPGDLTGRPVTLTIDLPGRPHAEFPGTVVFVSPEVNPVNGQIRIWAEIDNPDLKLRPGQQALMTIHAPSTRQDSQ